ARLPGCALRRHGGRARAVVPVAGGALDSRAASPARLAGVQGLRVLPVAPVPGHARGSRAPVGSRVMPEMTSMSSNRSWLRWLPLAAASALLLSGCILYPAEQYPFTTVDPSTDFG